MKDESLYLVHMLECIEAIEKYAKGKSVKNFAKPGMFRDAILRNLQLIGEDSKKISKKTKNKMPQIPWQKIVDFRNVVVHEYMFLNDKLIWKVIKDELPELKKAVSRALKDSKS